MPSARDQKSIYRSKYSQSKGTSYPELIKHARHEYHIVQKRTPRRIPHVKSKYFTKDKIFINNFWDHLNQKSPKVRSKRLKLYKCAIDLIRNTKISPKTFQNPENKDELLHRFYGVSKDGQKYAVQIKENKKTNRKDFISVFPVNKTN